MICSTFCPLCRLLVNSRTRSRSFFVAFALGHRYMKCQRGFRWILRFLRIVHRRNAKLSFPRLKSTNRVFTDGQAPNYSSRDSRLLIRIISFLAAARLAAGINLG